MVAVEVVGVASASAEGKLLALLRFRVVSPARETGPAHTRLFGQLADIHGPFAVLTAFLERFEIVLVAFASAVDELLASFGRGIVEIAREQCPAVARLCWLTATVDAFELITLRIDKSHFAIVARIGHAKRVRMERASRVEALVPANGGLDTRVRAYGTQSSLFQHGAIGRTTD